MHTVLILYTVITRIQHTYSNASGVWKGQTSTHSNFLCLIPRVEYLYHFYFDILIIFEFFFRKDYLSPLSSPTVKMLVTPCEMKRWVSCSQFWAVAEFSPASSPQTQPCHWRRGKRSVPQLETSSENSTSGEEDRRTQSVALFQSLQVLKEDEQEDRGRSDATGTHKCLRFLD